MCMSQRMRAILQRDVQPRDKSKQDIEVMYRVFSDANGI